MDNQPVTHPVLKQQRFVYWLMVLLLITLASMRSTTDARNVATATPVPATPTRTAAEQRANDHNNLGAKYINEGNFRAAKAEFTLAISLNPKFALAYNNRAVAEL